MIKVGITGGIGSGKTTICNFFKVLGIPVFEADAEAKQIMNSSSTVQSRIKLAFGNDIYLHDNTIDRKKLAKLIFNSPTLLETINLIIHPEVRKYFNEWCGKQTSPYIVYEAAIIFETGFHEELDFSVLITAPVEERIKRVMERENTSEEDIRSRIEKQWTDEQKMKLADYTIINDNRELIVPQLLELDKKFKSHG